MELSKVMKQMNARKELKELDLIKIRARYNAKRAEFDLLPLKELKDIYNTKKMSATDRAALVYVTNSKLLEDASENAEIIDNNPIEDGSSTQQNKEEVQS